MSHKVSLKEANEKYERELEIRELVKQGKYTSKRRTEDCQKRRNRKAG